MSDVEITVYRISDGVILRSMRLPNLQAVTDNLAEGESYLMGMHPLNGGWVESGEFVEQPSRPDESDHWEWNKEMRVWADSRPPLSVRLENARVSASLSKVAFIVTCLRARIITGAEAEEAAEGKIPASFVPIIDAMPPEVRIEARIAWKASTVMERTDPLILSIAAAIGLTDAQLDALFGITLE